MKNKYEDIWLFILSYAFMFFGILFFIGLGMVFDLPFIDILIILIFGWVTLQSFFVIINILVNNLRRKE